VREVRVTRALVALICIAVLLLLTAISPSAAHLNFAILVLAFCFLAVLAPALLRLADGHLALQPISLLSVHLSRAPPLA